MADVVAMLYFACGQQLACLNEPYSLRHFPIE